MRRLSLLTFLLFLIVSVTYADDLDDYIQKQLQKRQVSGLSIAIIQNGKIVKAKGYGFIDKNGKIPVTPLTLFQAGSISKSVTAVGVLKLVELGKLFLDEDVNTKLLTWKVPENDFTNQKKVTLRGLLIHTTGLTVDGFPGYEVGKPIPTVVQILEGVPPANTPAVRVDFVPGTRSRYSGGGYTVMQQLLVDVTGQSFPAYMQQTVLSPLGMQQSTFQQPLPILKEKVSATGYYDNRRQVNGRWHIYPEMAAAGLWTTPSDLARFAIGIQQSFAGKTGGVLSQGMTQQMLTGQTDNDGLGVFLEGKGYAMRFGYTGRNDGFDATMKAGIETGQGVVIMLNANDNSNMVGRIINEVARTYQWADYASPVPTKRGAVSVPAQQLTAYEGRYEFANNQMVTFMAAEGQLVVLSSNGLPDEEFVPQTTTRFMSADRDAYLRFHPNTKGAVTELVWKEKSDERKLPRIGPLFHTLRPVPDSDPARTRKIETALQAMAKGGKVVEDARDVTNGVRRAYNGGANNLSALRSIKFVRAEDVNGRGIERHQGQVSQVLHYTFTQEDSTRYLLVYLTADGQVADCDVVEK